MSMRKFHRWHFLLLRLQSANSKLYKFPSRYRKWTLEFRDIGSLAYAHVKHSFELGSDEFPFMNEYGHTFLLLRICSIKLSWTSCQHFPQRRFLSMRFASISTPTLWAAAVLKQRALYNGSYVRPCSKASRQGKDKDSLQKSSRFEFTSNLPIESSVTLVKCVYVLWVKCVHCHPVQRGDARLLLYIILGLGGVPERKEPSPLGRGSKGSRGSTYLATLPLSCTILKWKPPLWKPKACRTHILPHGCTAVRIRTTIALNWSKHAERQCRLDIAFWFRCNSSDVRSGLEKLVAPWGCSTLSNLWHKNCPSGLSFILCYRYGSKIIQTLYVLEPCRI